jgi:hypothetical protein
MSNMNLPRRYRTIYICGAFGLGSTRQEDRETMRRVFDHLEPGGGLCMDHCLPHINRRWWELGCRR